MTNPFAIWLIFVLLVFLFCLIRPNAARIFLGFFFLTMAIGINIVTVLVVPQSYVEMGKNSPIPFYRWVFLNIIGLNPALFVLPIAAYQIAIALMMLNKNKWVKTGLIGGIVFLVASAPLGAETLPNLVLAGALGWLLRREFDTTFWESIRAKLRL
ncbi:MAG: hypothetical protein PHD74_08040 [Candidatus Krumholzibacteria bacterium]|nr:hypothetical protein [Candidatus Krumholzibacteria bacterium]MDD5348468.1 hypothetical protein [Candidatus Omnitrophota bacterium]